MKSPLPRWFLTALAALILFVPPLLLWRSTQLSVEPASMDTIDAYLRSAYARDFKSAYRFISSRDRQLKPERVYAREKGSFDGFPLQVTRKLAEFIEIRPLESVTEGEQARVKLNVKYPNAGSLAELLLDWDEDRLNALPSSRRRQILAALDRMKRTGQIKTIEGEEEFTLLKEGASWRVFLDWAAGVRVSYSAVVPESNVLEAVPVNEATTIRPNELFTIAYRVKNLTGETISTQIIHRIEPSELTEHLDIVECALLIPVQLKPGEESEFSSTYLVHGDLPESAKQLDVTYDFQVAPH
jgi:hypothetical protein